MLRDARSLVSGVSRVLRGDEERTGSDELERGGSEIERTGAAYDPTERYDEATWKAKYHEALGLKDSFLGKFKDLCTYSGLNHAALRALIGRYSFVCLEVEYLEGQLHRRGYRLDDIPKSLPVHRRHDNSEYDEDINGISLDRLPSGFEASIEKMMTALGTWDREGGLNPVAVSGGGVGAGQFAYLDMWLVSRGNAEPQFVPVYVLQRVEDGSSRFKVVYADRSHHTVESYALHAAVK